MWMALYGNRFGWFPYRREPWHWEYNPRGFKERFEANRGKSREVEFESELELEGDGAEQAAELELPASPHGPNARNCDYRGIPERHAVRALTAGNVACTQQSAHGVAGPFHVVSKAVARALEMLNNTIDELVKARKAVCAGATPAWPLLGDITLCWLRNGLSVNIDDIRVWTAGTFEPIRSVAEVIRRLTQVRKLIGSNVIRYVCHGRCDPTDPASGCVPGDWAFVCISEPCPAGTVPTIVHLCQNFWVPAVRKDRTRVPSEIHAEFQAQTIIHEASHLYYCTEDRPGHTIGVAECLAQFVAATNGSPLDSKFVARCIGTRGCRPPLGGTEVFQREISGSGFARRGPKRMRVLRTTFRPQNAIRLKGRPAVRR
jgi:hypothetical protein